MSAPLLRSRAASSGLRQAPAVRPTASRARSVAVPRRYNSSSSSSANASASLGAAKALLYGGALAGATYASYLYATDTRAFFYRWVAPPLLRFAVPDAEEAHNISTAGLKLSYELGVHPRERDDTLNCPELAVNVFGTELRNPIGIAAGLDKNAEIPDPLFALGAGIVEVGGCTPLPQAGNPKPRFFRVASLDGMVNRYGLNSLGADAMAMRLRDRLRRYGRTLGLSETAVLNGEANVPPGSLLPGRLLAVQVAKNKETDEKDERAVADDYVYCVRRLAKYADILVVNVSSPNTPGLRDLQATEPLTRLLTAVVDEAAKAERKNPPKVMVKVSPDEDEESQLEGIVQAIHNSGVDGVIVGNTTKNRSGLVPAGIKLTAREQASLSETGGYSGPALFSKTLDLVGRYRKLLDSHSFKSDVGVTGGPQKVIFASGGINTGEQAQKVLNAGASVAMVYTGIVYTGAGTITRIKRELKDSNSN